MCGIYGIVGKTNVRNVISSLKKLEYRGYDSCGLAYLYRNKSYLIKTSGNTNKLVENINNRNIDIAVGHTRWATNGSISPINAHPHTTSNNNFFVVHNGVIENYLEIINKHKFNMTSETDTEVIPHLLDEYTNSMSVIDAIKVIMHELIGSFAVVFLSKKDNKLYFFKVKSPLLIAINSEKVILASDNCVFETGMNVTILNDYNYGYVENNNYCIFSFRENEKWNTFYKDTDSINKKINEYYMLDEIKYQPDMILTISKKYSSISTKDFLSLINESNELVFIGAGSSYFVSSLLAKIYETKLRKRCISVVASEISFFNPVYKKTAFIFLSQSGETADICDAMYLVKSKGYKIVSICNNVNSSLGYNSDMIFPIFANQEVSVAATKSFTAMLYVGMILLDKQIINNRLLYCNEIEDTLMKWEYINNISDEILNMKNIFYIGKGIDYICAEEGALKLREISYLSCYSFQSGELKHGSIAMIDKNSICIALLTDQNYSRLVKSNLEELKSRGAKVYLISNCDKACDICLCGGVFSLVVCLQIIAYQVALKLKRNIDQPRNLAKSVTVQ
ncbi:MAG: glutamine--fructose-6-phosphate transaminase (isomerizing) [Anaeroplasma sp.]|nr:glutamine--fructose-6-phosphate transaminase (isomerizing) [Anaeroplasma sp.]